MSSSHGEIAVIVITEFEPCAFYKYDFHFLFIPKCISLMLLLFFLHYKGFVVIVQFSEHLSQSINISLFCWRNERLRNKPIPTV